MNWDAVGSIAELVASIGVIISLVYVAVQVRQNTQTGRSTAAVISNQSFSTFNLFLAQDLEACKAWWQGLAEPEQLSEDGMLRFMQLIGGFTINLQQAYALYREGDMDAATWGTNARAIKWLVTQKGFLLHWHKWAANHDSEFRKLINEEIQQAEAGKA